jgi:hypothetical protein
MIVVCKRGTKRLIKGHRYETNKVSSSRNILYIEGIGSFSLSLFTTVDGSDIPKVDYVKPGSLTPVNLLKWEDLKVDDILVCKSDRYKLFVNGGMYKIEDLIMDKSSRIMFRINQNNIVTINVPGAKSIISKDLPSSVNVTLENNGNNTSLVLTGNPNSYGNHRFYIKLDGCEDLKGSIIFSGWVGSNHIVDNNKYVKFVGVNRKIKVNPWSFRKLNSDELREMALGHILDGEEIKVITSSDKRNIDLVDDKDDVLLKTLAKSILDPNRHHLSIVDWASKKTGDKFQIESSDYEPYLKMTLSQILEKIK